MKTKGLLIDTIGQRTICLRGIARMYYEDGLPIGISVLELEKLGIEVSWLHIADDLIKAGWKNKAIIAKIREESTDSNINLDMNRIEVFLSESYENQREMIFNYLFGCTTNDVRNGANIYPLEFMKNKFIKNAQE